MHKSRYKMLSSFVSWLLFQLLAAHIQTVEIFKLAYQSSFGGGKFMTKLKGPNIFSGAVPLVVEERDLVQEDAQLEPRFTETGSSGVGNCDSGYCCSPSSG